MRSINTGYDYKLPSLFTLILSKVSARQILNAKNTIKIKNAAIFTIIVGQTEYTVHEYK